MFVGAGRHRAASSVIVLAWLPLTDRSRDTCVGEDRGSTPNWGHGGGMLAGAANLACAGRNLAGFRGRPVDIPAPLVLKNMGGGSSTSSSVYSLMGTHAPIRA